MNAIRDIVEDMTDDEDFVENVLQLIRPPRHFRQRLDHFMYWNDQEFKDRFRLSKPVVQFVVDKLRPAIISPTNRNFALTAEQMVFATLRFLATGSMLYVIGDLNGIDKSTASRVVYKVIVAIARLRNEFIQMPSTEEELAAVKQGFFNIAKFPRCIGALDCTHVKIESPGGENAEIFRNRKGFFSYNVQGICDAKLIIINIVCRWQGSAHDSMIFRNSRIRAEMEGNTFGEESLLLGDRGYPLKRYLITPLGQTRNRAEQLFNESQEIP